MTKVLNPKELAVELDTDAKRVRKFLRSNASGLAADAPGKGRRWAIEAKKVRSLRTKFIKWDEADRKATADAKAARNAATDAEVMPDDPTPIETPDDAPEGDEVTGDEVELTEV